MRVGARGRRLIVVVLVALVTAGAACGGDSSTSSAPLTAATSTSSAPTTIATSTPSSTPAPPSSTPAPSVTTGTGAPRQPASALGFGAIAFSVARVGTRPATAPEYCALLAESAQQQARGLMGFRDLAGYDGMIFRFASDTTGPFYMRNVPVGLSIAWFEADGRFVSSTDMAPCPDQEGCPTYAPAGPYRLALEVLEGGLGRLGVGEGSVLTVGGPCRPPEAAPAQR